MGPEKGADAFPDLHDIVIRHVLTGYTADIVFSEYLGIHNRFLVFPCRSLGALDTATGSIYTHSAFDDQGISYVEEPVETVVPGDEWRRHIRPISADAYRTESEDRNCSDPCG